MGKSLVVQAHTQHHQTLTGRLTAAGFASGFIERKTSKRKFHQGLESEVITEIWMEGNTYHVRQVRMINGAFDHREYWDNFDTVNEARNRFNRAPGYLTSKARKKETS